MITVYCDASGKYGDALTTVCGVVSSAARWRLFDGEWRQVLMDFGLKFSHMSDFAHSVKQFKSWKGNESKRRALLQRLMSVFHSHVEFWTGVCILKHDYEEADAGFELHENISPYTVCALGCVETAAKWHNAHHREDGIEYVFEEGDEDFSQLRRVLKGKGVIPVETKKREATPCQAADLAAYELFKAYKSLLVESDKIFEKYRAPFMGLNAAAAGRWGQYEAPALRVLCRVLEIPPRLSPLAKGAEQPP